MAILDDLRLIIDSCLLIGPLLLPVPLLEDLVGEGERDFPFLDFREPLELVVLALALGGDPCRRADIASLIS